VKAVCFNVSIPRYLLTYTLGKIYPPILWSPLAMVQYREVPEPELPGPDWVKIKTRYGGICGSDMGMVLLHVGFALEPLNSSSFVIGHENLGAIAETGAGVEGFSVGDRVVADPYLSCAARGISEPCDYCQRGEYNLCQHYTDGDLAPGLIIGSCSDTGGSWSPFFVAHKSVLYHVPESVSDESAALIDPFCTSLHAVLRNYPGDEMTVLVIGAGIIGLGTVLALRALGSRARIIVLARYPYQAEAARERGADEVILSRGGLDVYQAVAELTGARLFKPSMGKRIMVGGADQVFDCVGSDDSIDDALRFTASGGTMVLVGAAEILKNVDWTPIWLNELTVRGSYACGTDTYQGRRVHTYQLALDMMAQGKVDLAPFLTHRFRLADYKKALATTAARGRNGVIKSAFVFD
jgi:threonine dehydrogenase-like Zn-dependent dehydrogenase